MSIFAEIPLIIENGSPILNWDHLKICHPKPLQGDASSGEKFWGDASSGGNFRGDGSSGVKCYKYL